jgi:hypothetical protein
MEWDDECVNNDHFLSFISQSLYSQLRTWLACTQRFHGFSRGELVGIVVETVEGFG